MWLKKSILFHKTSYFEFECLNTSLQFSAQDASNSLINTQDKTGKVVQGFVECEICQYKTKYKSNFKCHMKVHSSSTFNNNDIFVCHHHYGNIYKTKYGLKKHTDSIHLDKPKFRCQMPNYTQSFMERSKYKAHISMHSELKCFKSKMCNNEYRYDYYLKEHEKTCKVLPSILCDICGEILGN